MSRKSVKTQKKAKNQDELMQKLRSNIDGVIQGIKLLNIQAIATVQTRKVELDAPITNEERKRWIESLGMTVEESLSAAEFPYKLLNWAIYSARCVLNRNITPNMTVALFAGSFKWVTCKYEALSAITPVPIDREIDTRLSMKENNPEQEYDAVFSVDLETAIKERWLQKSSIYYMLDDVQKRLIAERDAVTKSESTNSGE